MANIHEISEVIWSIADSVLGRTYKRYEYQNVILPFTVLKRFDDLLKYSKKDVIDAYDSNKNKTEFLSLILMTKSIDENGHELGFYNYSRFDFKTLLQDPDNLEYNIKFYINSFSSNVTDILENFGIEKQIAKLSKANLLYLLIKKFNETSLDLSPENISNQDMGAIFEELIRKSFEASNGEAGEHFTPRDVVKLMTELLFTGEKETSGSIKSVYDPTCGTGGMLTNCNEFFTKNNIDVELYGQEINREVLAISKANMLLRGKDSENIKGPFSTLSNDQFPHDKFDYIISNPPYGHSWRDVADAIIPESELGFYGRFGAGLPRQSDEQLLFLQHMISKMKTNTKSKIIMITNVAPLYAGDIGSGESNIRKWIIENDYLEVIIALPKNIFYNTFVDTYIWILTNQKEDKRKGKVQLINAVNDCVKIKSSFNKKNTFDKKSISKIVRKYKQFKENDGVKIINNIELGYQKIIIERPMQLNFQVNEDRLKNLYSYSQFKKLSESKNSDIEMRLKEEAEGREKQERIINSLKTIPNKVYYNQDIFEKDVIRVLEPFHLKPNFIKNIIDKLSKHDENADYVTDKKGNIKMNPNLAEIKKLPLSTDLKEYLDENVLIDYPNATINYNKIKIGYEINFKHLIFDDEIFFGDIDFPIYYLEEVVEFNPRPTHDYEDYDLFIVPRRNKIIYYLNELPADRLKEYTLIIGCKLNSNKVLKEYLYHYFNSNKGLKSILYFQQGSHITVRDLKYIRVPIPNIETQKKIVETCRLMDGFFNEMEIWRNDFSNNILNFKPALDSYKEFSCTIKFGEDGGVNDFCRNWRIVYQGLIWPIAYTYLKATKGSKNESIMKNNYLVLFEFFAAFNAIILISGITDSDITPEQLKNIKDELWKLRDNNKKTWHRMSFGSWTTLYSRLSKIYKKEKYEFITPINRDFFNKLSEKRYSKLFNKLRDKERNPDSHGGFEDHIDVEIKLDDLKVYMDTDIFNILNIYAGYKLYYITDEIRKIEPKKICHKVMSLNGPCDPPNWHKLVHHEELIPHGLYLYDVLNNSYLKINSDLMKFKQIENSKQYGIYLYDGIDIRRKVAKYKCYHRKNEIWEIPIDNEKETYHDLTKDYLIDVLRLKL